MVRQAIKLTGRDWPVKEGDTVLLKPNLVSDWVYLLATGKGTAEAVQATLTDIRTVRGAAIVALESGARKVLFAEGPARGDAYANMVAFGYEDVVEELNQRFGEGKAELLDITKEPYHFHKPTRTGGLALPEYGVNDVFADPNIVLISVSAMKTHSFAGVTLNLKNIGIGCPSCKVYGLPKLGLPHQRLGEVIVDVCDICKPKYAITSAIWAMEGNGPEGGSAVPMGMILAGKDLVAVDWVATEVMGFNGDSVLTTVLADKYGLGTYKNVNVVGRPISEVKTTFEPVPRKDRAPFAYPHNMMEGYTPAVGKEWHY
jgi:uncharacterized protein (DUF362 family)